MILNCVESFYAFLLHFRSKRNEEDGWPATARPPIGVTGHDLATCKGVSGCGQAPCKGATSCGQGPLHRGRPTTASPQGTARSVRPQGQHQPMARPQGLAARGEATGAAPTRGQPAKGRRPPPARAAAATAMT
ncbi:hypothetical protein BHE74_00053730 [Ensete ventricosum]|nr:hypothetical protein BHE74_00053730 [Ensete ventricosum]